METLAGRATCRLYHAKVSEGEEDEVEERRHQTLVCHLLRQAPRFVSPILFLTIGYLRLRHRL